MEEHLLDVDRQTREAIVIPRLGGQDREVAGRRRPFVRQGEGERMDLAPFLEPVIPQAVAGVRLIAWGHGTVLLLPSFQWKRCLEPTGRPGAQPLYL